MKPKKVILLAHEHLYGGGTKQTFFLAQALVASGVETVLISNGDKTWLGQTIQQSGLPIKTYYSSRIQRAIRPWHELQVLFFLIQVYRKEKPDVVLASGVKLIGLSGLAAWICGVPQRFAIIRGEGAAPGSRLLKLIYGMLRLLGCLDTRYITVSEYIRQQMLKQHVCLEERILTIHDGISVSSFRPAAGEEERANGLLTHAYNLPVQAFKIGMVGRFVAGKRYDHFIQLMDKLCQEFPHVYGFLIGEGENRPVLETLLKETGFEDRILVVGYCSEMTKIYQSLDLSILFTDYEGCPNSILESMACQVPVLASNVCGIGEIIASGNNGLLVSPGNIEEAIDLTRRVIQNPAFRKTLGQTGYSTVVKHFELTVQLKALISVLLCDPPKKVKK